MSVVSWWGRQRRGRQALWVSIALICGILLVAGASSLLISVTSQPERPAPAGDGGTTATSPTSGSESEEVPPAPAPGWVPVQVPVDDLGLAVMPVTRNPREAAAAAAAIAFTTDTTRLDWAGYVEEARRRMTLSGAADFVGPRPGEALNVQTADAGWQQVSPALSLSFKIHLWQRANSRYWNWWALSQQSKYDGLAITDTVWTGTPLEVYDLAEVQAMGVRAPVRAAGQAWEAVTEGATLGDYWVRVRVEHSMGGHVYTQETVTAVVSIWCDPPQDGGTCAAIDVLDGPIPDRWAE